MVADLCVLSTGVRLHVGVAAHPGSDSSVRRDSVTGKQYYEARGGQAEQGHLSHPPVVTGRHQQASDGQEQTI